MSLQERLLVGRRDMCLGFTLDADIEGGGVLTGRMIFRRQWRDRPDDGDGFRLKRPAQDVVRGPRCIVGRLEHLSVAGA